MCDAGREDTELTKWGTRPRYPTQVAPKGGDNKSTVGVVMQCLLGDGLSRRYGVIGSL